MTLSVPRSIENFTHAIFPMPGAGAVAPMSLVPEAVSVGVNAMWLGILMRKKSDPGRGAQRFAEVAPLLKSPVPVPDPSLDDQLALLQQEIERLRRSDDPFDHSRARLLDNFSESLQLMLGVSLTDFSTSVDPHTIVDSLDPTGAAVAAAVAAEYSPLQEEAPFATASAVINWAITHQGSITEQFGGMYKGGLVPLTVIVTAVVRSQKMVGSGGSALVLAAQVEVARVYWQVIEPHSLAVGRVMNRRAANLWGELRPFPGSNRLLNREGVEGVLYAAYLIYNGTILIPGLTRDPTTSSLP